MKIIFMGTPDFAVPSLKRLIEDGHEIQCVVTQADKPKGRGHKLTPPPVKDIALSYGIPVFQPATLKTDEAFDFLKAFAPDCMVVVAYGKLLPQRILDIPKYGCINVHGSLLPRYRGAAPIEWAILNGEEEVGITTMKMAAGLDTGDMLLQCRRPLTNDISAGELRGMLAEDGASLLSQTLRQLAEGNLPAIPQDDSLSTYAPMLGKSLSPLVWSKSAVVLHNQVRGLNPWPAASFTFEEKSLKVYKSQVGDDCQASPGTIVKLNPFTVACGENTSLILLEVQYEGSKRMPAQDFLRGHPVMTGTVLE